MTYLVTYRRRRGNRLPWWAPVTTVPAPALEQVIQAVRELDMDTVREQVAAQRAGDNADQVA